MKNLDFLLNQSHVEKILNQNSNKIFGENFPIKLISLARSHTYNPEAYNLLYKIDRNNHEEFLRVSSSRIFSKESDYQIMDYLYSNGFNHGEFLVPRPIVFLKEKNLLFYENVDGRRLTNIWNKGIEISKKLVSDAANLLKKIHAMPLPNYSLFDTELLFEKFNIESINNRFPELGNNKIRKIIQDIKIKLKKNNSKVLCHGDFNPNNILVVQDKMYIIDFGLTCIFYKEIDLASFLTHLRLMLHQVSQSDNFDILKNIFISNYGEYDDKKLSLIMTLIDIRLLEIAINYKQSGYDDKYVFSCLNKDIQNIK